mgnify:CR=1 FL=1
MADELGAGLDDAHGIAGAQVADFEPFAWFKLLGNEKQTSDTAKIKSMGIGLRYKMGEWAPYAAYRKDSSEDAATSTSEGTSWGFGLGRSTKLAEGARMNYAVGYFRSVGTTAANNGRSVLVSSGAASRTTRSSSVCPTTRAR